MLVNCDDFLAAAAEKPQRRLHFRSHVSRRKLSGSVELFQFFCRHAAAGAGSASCSPDKRSRYRWKWQRCPPPARKQAAPKRDLCRSRPPHPGTAIRLRTTGIPPPPQAITSTPAFTNSRITASSTISTGSGEGTTRRYPRAASSTIVHPNKPLLLFRVGPRIEGADGLGRMLHRRVVERYDRLRHHADHRDTGMPAAASSRRNACASRYPISPLAGRAADVQRLPWNLIGRALGPQQ